MSRWKSWFARIALLRGIAQHIGGDVSWALVGKLWRRFWRYIQSLRRGVHSLEANVSVQAKRLEANVSVQAKRLEANVSEQAERLADQAHKLGAQAERLEANVAQQAQKLGENLQQIQEDVRQLGQEFKAELWDLVDDLPFLARLRPMEPVRNQFYGHGAFMGAGPALLADPQWRRILAFLMPDVFFDVSEALKEGASEARLIPMFENNPVMCAFGLWRGILWRRTAKQVFSPHDLTGTEWDVFIDSDKVAAWEKARDPQARAALLTDLVDTMVIAHASTTDTVQESMGVCQYHDVRRTPKAELGGVQPDAWLDLFLRALRLAQAPDLREAIERMSTEPRTEATEACLLNTFANPIPAREVVQAFREFSGRPHFSIVLEIKSLRSTPAFLSEVVRELNRKGLHVAAVCSFLLQEVQGVSQTQQDIDGERLPGPREIIFTHFVGDLQEACDQGRVPKGQSVLFNGASLLNFVGADEPGGPGYRVKEDVMEELEEYREKYDLHLGMYVQEGDCDVAAAHALSELAQRAHKTLELGFAWGGLPDEVAVESDGLDRRGFGGQGLLAYVGKARHWKTRAERSALALLRGEEP